jgi:hypothetical protein
LHVDGAREGEGLADLELSLQLLEASSTLVFSREMDGRGLRALAGHNYLLRLVLFNVDQEVSLQDKEGGVGLDVLRIFDFDRLGCILVLNDGGSFSWRLSSSLGVLLRIFSSGRLACGRCSSSGR